MRSFVLASALASSGCSTLLDKSEPLQDWPKLSITTNHVSFMEVLSHCSKYATPLNWPPFGCSEFNLITKQATIWCMNKYVCGVEMEYMLHGTHFGDTQANAVRAMKEYEAAQIR